MLLLAYYFGFFATAASEPTDNSLELKGNSSDYAEYGYYLFDDEHYYDYYFDYYEYSQVKSDCKSTQCVHSDKSLYCTCLPEELPLQATHLYITYNRINRIFILEPGLFNVTKNWNHLKFLQLENLPGINNYAMTGLKTLEELHFSGDSLFLLYRDSFAGLDNLKVLSFSGCKFLQIESLINAIASPNVLTNLQTFSVKDMVLTKTCSEVLQSACVKIFTALMDKPLELINMNLIITEELDFIPCLLFSNISAKLNISFSTFYNMRLGQERKRDQHNQTLITSAEAYSLMFREFMKQQNIQMIKDLILFDASNVFLPMITQFVKHALKLQNEIVIVPREIAAFVSKAEIVNISGIYRHSNAVKLKNLYVNILQYFSRQSPTRELIVRNNRLQYLDVTFQCTDSKLEKLDLSSNVIEFIRPNICPCCTTLLQINLSDNNLFEMVDRNYSLFGQLLSSYPSLQIIQLSFNKLTEIPTEMFNENINLETIDLSDNSLPKITFSLRHLLNLKFLILENNKISTLDHMSLTNLQSLNVRKLLPKKSSGILKMNGNPFVCSECYNLSFTKWLASTPLIDRNGNNIFCKNHEGINVHADHTAVEHLREECDKPKWMRKVILLSTIIPVSVIALISIFICILLKNRRRRIKRKNVEEKIELIQQNQLDTRFVVFLSYSSEDTDFMNKYVYNSLEFHLREKLQTDRDVICLGDRHFQLGKPVNDEMVKTLQQSAVVLLLVTRNFSNSEFCRMEFDHALFMKKPFILMVKGEIDVNEMVPSMQEVFKRNTRLLWEWDGDNFVMKTSWDNVVSSILDLI
ncbi:toll-like receptor 8 [Mercenaria mercenaria]|uniref:toll-like receptor 8 n=1 Tax=Mercenaria mercenaria TaxID=6596 RepID=UPI00234FA072|nr:toll-like receptor 8 [Mercenaria mercenaria]